MSVAVHTECSYTWGCRLMSLSLDVFSGYTALYTAYRLMPMASRTAIQLGAAKKAGRRCSALLPEINLRLNNTSPAINLPAVDRDMWYDVAVKL